MLNPVSQNRIEQLPAAPPRFSGVEEPRPRFETAEAKLAAEKAERKQPQTIKDKKLDAEKAEVRKVLNQFLGNTFFSQMLSQMRKSVDKSAYFDGGRGEEIFRGQLDQVLTEKMTEASSETFTQPMIELYMLQRYPEPLNDARDGLETETSRNSHEQESSTNPVDLIREAQHRVRERFQHIQPTHTMEFTA